MHREYLESLRIFITSCASLIFCNRKKILVNLFNSPGGHFIVTAGHCLKSNITRRLGNKLYVPKDIKYLPVAIDIHSCREWCQTKHLPIGAGISSPHVPSAGTKVATFTLFQGFLPLPAVSSEKYIIVSLQIVDTYALCS